MPSNLPLTGKTIILTGSQKVQTIAPFIEKNGGKVLSIPLIEVKELIADDDDARLEGCNDYDWLIFTSQNAVSAFTAKLARAGLLATDIHCKIAVVGEKTAESIQHYGFRIHFMPSVYSADIFVQEFDFTGRALFVRGSLAKPTITIGTGADEWTVYETVPSKTHIELLDEAIVSEAEPIVVFASPSAVHAYAKEIVPKFDWRDAKYATIGHVTTKALAEYGVAPVVQPRHYTMKAVIEEMILEEKNS